MTEWKVNLLTLILCKHLDIIKRSEAVELRVKHYNPVLRKGEVKNVRCAPAVADSKGACLSV